LEFGRFSAALYVKIHEEDGVLLHAVGSVGRVDIERFDAHWNHEPFSRTRPPGTLCPVANWGEGAAWFTGSWDLGGEQRFQRAGR
jgi:hypothetical protein